MKKFIQISLIAVFFCSCDPTSNMEANIENLTTQNLIIEFLSSDQTLNKTLQIDVNETKLFQESLDIGNDFLEPSLIEYDSVVVKNNEEQILKIYKPNDSGKNIYNTNEHWLSSEPSKRFFIYKYEIFNDDLE